jgi:hypothetical protein
MGTVHAIAAQEAATITEAADAYLAEVLVAAGQLKPVAIEPCSAAGPDR